MVGQGIQKHNPDSIDEGYCGSPGSYKGFEDKIMDDEDVDESEDTINVSYKPEYIKDMDKPEDEDTLDYNILNKTFIIEDTLDYNILNKTFIIEDTLDYNILNKTFIIEDTLDHNILNKAFIIEDGEGEPKALEATNASQSDITMYKQVDECIRKNTLSTLLSTRRQASTLHLYSDETVAEGMIKESLELIALGKDKKIMFGMPCYAFSENTSLIDFLVRNLYILKTQELSTYERYQLDLLSSKMSDLVSTGTYMSEEALKLLPTSLLEKHTSYLSNLKQIVCEGIEKDGEENVIKDVIVERDNKFYCIQCPEASIVIPAKFLSNPEFQNLDGALKIGEGDDVIRIQDGKYHDIKGRFQMTFPISNSEKIVMTLSSEKADKPENASSFGKIIVHMDDRSSKIFSKYLKELEKEPRISKVVEAAKSFVQNKSPLSSIDDANVQQLQSNVESLQSSGQSLG